MDVAVLLLFTALVVVALGSHGNGTGSDGVGSTAGSALAIYSLLGCLISASSLVRRPARSAIDPQEG